MHGVSRTRLHGFRVGLAAFTRRASPLAVAIIAAERLPLDRIVRWLRPMEDDPGVRGFHLHLRHAHARFTRAHHLRGRAAIEDAAFTLRYGRRGVVVRKPSHPRGRYAVWAAGGSLNAVTSLGDHVLHVEGGSARLDLAETIPLTVRMAITGRPIGAVAEHPLLSDRTWIVTGCHDEDGGTAIAFDTGFVPIPPLFGLRRIGPADRRSPGCEDAEAV